MEEVIVVDTESRIAQAIISCLSMIGDEARLKRLSFRRLVIMTRDPKFSSFTARSR
jgi:hypothetical protein